jgi:hypothetical protein
MVVVIDCRAVACGSRAVAELVGNEGGVVSGVFNLESFDVDPGYAEALAEVGRMTANSHVYTYKHFRAAWRKQFSLTLGSVPRQENLRAA